ncbi:MAG: hypothetical protein K2J89_00615 [Clostridia bacterium]|nr:hypothetical protein [Clostridia bacterium]
MKKIILVDNHKADIDLLSKLLKDKFNSFVKNFNKIEGVRLKSGDIPSIEGYYYKEETGEFIPLSQSELSGMDEEDFVSKLDDEEFLLKLEKLDKDGFLSKLDKDCYCLVDLCLTLEEEYLFTDDNINSKGLVSDVTGYKLTEEVAKKVGKASITTRFFIPAKVGNYAPIIAKPLFRNSYQEVQIDIAIKVKEQYLTYLPKELASKRPDESFCSIVYYNFFAKSKRR